MDWLPVHLEMMELSPLGIVVSTHVIAVLSHMVVQLGNVRTMEPDTICSPGEQISPIMC